MRHCFILLIGTGLFFFTIPVASASEGPVAQWANHTLVLNNGTITRKVVYDANQHSIRTTELKLQVDGYNYSGPSSDEFSFDINGKVCRGGAGWEFKQFEPVDDVLGGKGGALVLRSARPQPSKSRTENRLPALSAVAGDSQEARAEKRFRPGNQSGVAGC